MILKAKISGGLHNYASRDDANRAARIRECALQIATLRATVSGYLCHELLEAHSASTLAGWQYTAQMAVYDATISRLRAVMRVWDYNHREEFLTVGDVLASLRADYDRTSAAQAFHHTQAKKRQITFFPEHANVIPNTRRPQTEGNMIALKQVADIFQRIYDINLRTASVVTLRATIG